MSRPRVQSCVTVPSARPQRTPPATVQQAMDAPKPATHYYGLTLSESIGRLPTIGIDPGAVPGSRPDQSPITKRST